VILESQGRLVSIKFPGFPGFPDWHNPCEIDVVLTCLFLKIQELNMQEIISFHIVPPGNLCVRVVGGHFRPATELETIRFFKLGVSLQSLRGWGSSYIQATQLAA